MRWLGIALLVAGCARPAWVAPAVEEEVPAAEAARDGMRRAWEEAGRERELTFAEAMWPGARREERRRRLAEGSLESFRSVGEALFALDAPWSAAPPREVQPSHAQSGPATADATRCRGCHHVGGRGGSGRFADLARFDADGDDVLSARRRLPRMLAGAALLERAAAGHGERHPFGWAPGRPRRLRELVAWSIATHLATEASDEEIDALTVFVALLPTPVAAPLPRDSLRLRAAHGAELFRGLGCADCHRPRLPVDDPVLVLASGRRLDLRRRLSPSGQPPYEVAAFTDLLAHPLGAAVADGEPGGSDRFVTAPLWGLSSRGPFLHDGRAATIQEAILAHGGEAEPARRRYLALGSDETDLLLFLQTLSRPPVLSWVR